MNRPKVTTKKQKSANSTGKSKSEKSKLDKNRTEKHKLDRAKPEKQKFEELHRFIGVSLSGGRADKACVAVVEYFPNQKRVFLSRLYEKIKSEEHISADLKIFEIITQYHGKVDFVAFDAPLTWPKCVRCKLKCPGFETCSEVEIEWMRELYSEVNKQKKPKKMFTPYTQRCVEAYLSHVLSETGDVQHALGSNSAPLAARAQFVERRLSLNCIEVLPKLSVWRIGSQLKVSKTHLKSFRNSVSGDEARRLFLEHLIMDHSIFVYQQDQKSLIENFHGFDAFICAYSAFLKFLGETESRPNGFPNEEAWIEFPKKSLHLKKFAP